MSKLACKPASAKISSFSTSGSLRLAGSPTSGQIRLRESYSSEDDNEAAGLSRVVIASQTLFVFSLSISALDLLFPSRSKRDKIEQSSASSSFQRSSIELSEFDPQISLYLFVFSFSSSYY